MEQEFPEEEANANVEEVNMEEQEETEEEGVRNFRPRQPAYTQEQRERAIQLLDAGVSCRQVARSLGPRCSSGTPIRWRKLKRKQDAARAAMEEMLKRPGNAYTGRRR